jgi:DNA-binding transcriptional ArsR family regulator
MIDLNSQQLTCLASPTRNQVFMSLRKLGKASARELAEDLDRDPELLHYHLKALLKAGLIRESGRRPTARKPEGLYEATASQYRLPDLVEQPELASITRKAVAAGMRETVRKYLAAAERAESEPELRRSMHIIRANLRLSPDDAQEFMRLIEAASDFAKEHERKDGVRLQWASLVSPG